MSCFSPGIALTQAFFTEETLPPATLMGSEVGTAASFVEKRMREFATGRHCARMALRGLGLSPGPIPMGAQREPCWPDGVAGSISHTDGLSGSIVAWRRDYKSMGLDIERMGAVGEELLPLVLTPFERDWVAGDTALATVVFSLKEAFYKMQYPLSGQFLDFQEVEVDRDLEQMRILRSFPEIGDRILGHRIWGGYVITWALAG